MNRSEVQFVYPACQVLWESGFLLDESLVDQQFGG